MQTTKYLLHQAARLVAVAFLLGVAACQEPSEDARPKTISDVIIEKEEFSTLREAIKYAGLSDALRSNGLTLFAPTNTAFEASGYANAAAMTALPAAAVRQLLEYHLLGAEVLSADLGTGTNLEIATFAKTKAYITKTSGGTSINGARVLEADLKAANGVVHVIDRVIAPATFTLLELVRSNPEYSYLQEVLALIATTHPQVAAAFTSEKSATTLFLPTNQAFIDAGFASTSVLRSAAPSTLAALVQFHSVPGRLFSTNLSPGNLTTAANKTVRVENMNGLGLSGPGNRGQLARITRADLLARNGVIHVIDRLLLP
jgi:uncharacterized surface protein with fasciclin (FAS1) repeats